MFLVERFRGGSRNMEIIRTAHNAILIMVGNDAATFPPD
jgi:hypothetical protein